jgi:hypothetical protein
MAPLITISVPSIRINLLPFTFPTMPSTCIELPSNRVSHGYIGPIGQWWLPVFIIGGADLSMISIVFRIAGIICGSVLYVVHFMDLGKEEFLLHFNN